MATDPAAPLKEMQPEHEFFVGIDSDGCVFDTMEIKQKECFCPNTVRLFRLQAVSKYVREATEFVNLYSKWRGVNRWPALIMVFDLLEEREEVKRRGIEIPKVPRLRRWIKEETKLSNSTLKALAEKEDSAELRHALQWSETVNATVAETVFGVTPFPYVRESLEKLRGVTDSIVVSQTPTEALEREWKEHKVDGYVRFIAGQEQGTKSEHIAFAAGGKYPKEKMLMIGDAPGDRKAAEANGALFFPVNPGEEEASWRRFHDEALDRFLKGTFAGEYARQLNEEFERRLPDTPPWERK